MSEKEVVRELTPEWKERIKAHVEKTLNEELQEIDVHFIDHPGKLLFFRCQKDGKPVLDVFIGIKDLKHRGRVELEVDVAESTRKKAAEHIRSVLSTFIESELGATLTRSAES